MDMGTNNAVLELTPIAFYRGQFGSKFGIPRQSSLATGLRGVVEFCPQFRNPDAVKGLEGFGRVWLIWGFSAVNEREWHATVRPPRLGGNESVGVWASRSPFRPNPLGLSCVELLEVGANGLVVGGADLMDGTPIYDIKPYVPYADSFPDAPSAYASEAPRKSLEVVFEPSLKLQEGERKALEEVLSLDPRPAVQSGSDKLYGFPFGGKEVRFYVRDGILHVTEYA